MKKITTLSFLFFLVMTELYAQAYTTQEAQISAEGALLATRLCLPKKPIRTPAPVLLIVHGSGKQAYWENYKPLVERLVSQGLAVCFYDKRGTGASSGKYLDIDVKKSTKNFKILSDDAQVVLSWLNGQKSIDSKRIGTFGISQGGWIAPIVALESDALDFSIIVSGPVCSLGHEKLFSKLAGDEKAKAKMSLEEINQKVKAFDGTPGFDSYPVVAQMQIPSLWLFGAQDMSMPVALSVENLQVIMEEFQKKDFEYKIYEQANHGLINVNTEERENYATFVKDWILEHLYSKP